MLPRASLRPEQVLVVNCPGEVPRPAIRQVKEFVRLGGSLFTTDRALRHVLEPAFPGVLEYNERSHGGRRRADRDPRPRAPVPEAGR